MKGVCERLEARMNALEEDRTQKDERMNALEEEGRAKDERLKAQEAVIQGLLTTIGDLGATIEKLAQTRVLGLPLASRPRPDIPPPHTHPPRP